MEDLQSFIGRREVRHDTADPERVRRLAAVLDHDSPPWRPGLLPPLAHWLCFQPDARQSLLGADGHPVRTEEGLLPDVDLPRRMWVGSRIRFLHDVPLGSEITCTSQLMSATRKSGRSGDMVLALVRHEVACKGREAAIVEEQDIAFRAAPPSNAIFDRRAIDAGAPDPVSRRVALDSVALFRYSALTFNAHRIHYDRDYARKQEGYPDLVVHGPLLATLLLDLLLRHRPGTRIEACNFRAESPIFAGEDITLGLSGEGTRISLRAIGAAGVAMTASAQIAL